MKTITRNLEETYKLAKEFIDKALVRPPAEGASLPARQAFVVLLKGDLGSGKTSFVQGIAHALGVTEHVTSPTFVLLKSYEVKNLKFKIKNLVHIDAYRLEGEKDLEVLGWEKLITDPNSIILIEWPEKVGLENYPTINFKFIDEFTREIEI